MKVININIENISGWSYYSKNNVNFWLKGYIINFNNEEIYNRIISIINHCKNFQEELEKLIKLFRGHFAIIVESRSVFFMAADQVGSIPLFYSYIENVFFISANAKNLRQLIGEDKIFLNKNATLEVEMSGCTINNETMIEGLFRLEAGNYFYLEEGSSSPKILSYYKFWDKSELHNSSDLNVILKDIFSSYIEHINGRQVIIPLSAGFDSRLIASMFQKFGYKNVICFTFGKINSFEHKIAEKVASKLGFKWVPIYTSRKKIREFLRSKEAEKYYDFSETYSNSPGMLDIFAIKQLTSMPGISKNAVIINGHTGDFISGSHIPKNVSNNILNSKKSNLDELSSHFLSKHFSLWKSYRTQKNDKKITNRLNLVTNKYLQNGKVPEYLIFETLELLTRQSKVILSNQKAYEFYNFSWMLPFWDQEYIKFWSNQPLEKKINGTFYKEELIRLNFGDVWQNIPINDKKIPFLVNFSRNFFKLFFIFSAKDNWQRFDNRWFYYFYEDSGNIGNITYFEAVKDQKGFRNTLSWRVKKYVDSFKKSLESISKT
jgi:asparagine synthase (glutamine-hydrolysing)